VSAFPERLVCLTEETTETLYLLGEGHRVVGVSGYTVRPPEARKKPRVSTYLTAKYDRIQALRPDVVLCFSDLQADIAAELIRRGLTVFTFNQRSVAEILQMMRVLGGLIGVPERAATLVGEMEAGLEAIRASASHFPRRPRVFFEEWNDPLISGIRWVDELVEIAGGEPCFPELRGQPAARERIVQPDSVLERNPGCVIASWCGRKVGKARIRGRPGWDRMQAVREGHVYEVASAYILQPGPASLTEGVRQLHALIARAAGGAVDPALAPREGLDPEAR
jgi:iron complex transport system substrate-binding protein